MRYTGFQRGAHPTNSPGALILAALFTEVVLYHVQISQPENYGRHFSHGHMDIILRMFKCITELSKEKDSIVPVDIVGSSMFLNIYIYIKFDC